MRSQQVSITASLVVTSTGFTWIGADASARMISVLKLVENGK